MSATAEAISYGPITERFANALREGRFERASTDTPHILCLYPILKALGWNEFSRELIEAIPHYNDSFDLTDLRNVLVTLGYVTEPHAIKLDESNPELYPSLLEAADGRLFVLISHNEQGVHYYDAQDHCEKEGHLPVSRGTAYYFTDSESHQQASANATTDTWTSRLGQRFRGLMWHLLAMTFLINLVAIIVPLAVMLIYDAVIGSRSLDSLPYVVAGVGIALAADFGFRQLRARLLGTVAGRLDYLIGVESFRQLMAIPPLYTERSSVGSQLSRLKQFDSIRSFFTGSGASVALELPFAVLSIAVIAFVAGPIAWVPVAAILIYALLGILVLPYLEGFQKKMASMKSDKQRLLLQTLEGHTEIKSVGVEGIWLQRFRDTVSECAMAGYQSSLANAVATNLGQMVMGLSALAVVGWGTFRVLEGALTVGGLIATMALIWRVLSPLQSAYLTASRAQQVYKSLGHINQLMKIGGESVGANAGLLLPDTRGQLRVDRLSFRYGPDQDPAVLGVSFGVNPGEILAITGTTGSGKSTVLKLIVGMYRPQAGKISLDDMDIRQLDAADLRRSIAYVPQEVNMFHGTIAQNLRLSNGLATQADLEAAAAEAGVLDDIQALPEGFQTRIGDNVTEQYPPGFIRGLGLARALLRQTRIILLDEPGASLDMDSDQRLVECLERMRGQRSVILVTHRPSHIRIADRAVLMDRGAVRHIGPPKEVINMMLEMKL